jgi:fructose-1,6-bisphosphatase/inositol monophosphatase family enzyme
VRPATVWFDNGMVNAELQTEVEDTLRRVAAEEILPRWRQLAAADISQKTGPGDLVTVADREAEARLTEALTSLLPGSVVVGEEAVHADPQVLERLHGNEPVWIVDPLDGTANFVAGTPEFATLVALALEGEVLASWTYVPKLGLMATARRGNGAYVNGARVHTSPPVEGEVLRISTSQDSFVTEQHRRQLAGLGTDKMSVRECRCAGLEYLELARGGIDAVAFTWEAPWDHAAGLLLTTEAGGASRTAAGEPFRITGGNALPFSIARDEPTARRVVGHMRAVR